MKHLLTGTVLFLPDIRPAGYPVNPKAGYRISGRIHGLTTIFLVKCQINFKKTAFNNFRLLQTLNKA
jgi:hypothetical protein